MILESQQKLRKSRQKESDLRNIFGVVLIVAQIVISRMGKHSLGQGLQKRATQEKENYVRTVTAAVGLR
ncbi:TPA: hypothetical protein MIV40_11050 [Klebsiella pneumoniae]|nr:hypothetical protein [Klebsiella pneumoniae]HBY1285185.1 hypothetical protein [Klebsiella pneumoniae]HBY4946974.1 hypothetical protein [Klebsiella pneumoniae]